jgi:NADH/F420H2 dehydrogenase subunit C
MKSKIKTNLIKNILNLAPILVYQNFKNLEFSLTTKSKNLIFTSNLLKNHTNFQYNVLSCISCADLVKSSYRFLISYDLLSILFNTRVRIKVHTNEYVFIPSLVSIYINSNWWEREIWDLYGIFFDKHPDLRRILTDYGFEGHPLRKDFPLFGFYEVRYDNTKKSMLYENISFSQEFRSFSFNSPW